MPTMTDIYDPEGKRQVEVSDETIKHQVMHWNILTERDTTRPDVIQSRSDTVVIAVHPEVAVADGLLSDVNQVDMDRLARQWDALVEQAEEAGLISMAYGGVMVLVHPETQLDEGLYQKIQRATGNRNRLTVVDGEE